MEIDFLWLDEKLQGQGLGKRLLFTLKAAAQKRGGRLAVLDTFSFQAPQFYQALGYEVFGEVAGYGRSHTKYFLRKQLSATPPTIAAHHSKEKSK